MSALTEKRTHTKIEDHEHGSGAYWFVWIALLVLTVVTYVTGRMHMPTYGIYIAMAIALTKATLVAVFFMHLREQKGVNRMVLVTSVIFVLIMFLGIFGDVFTRLATLLPRSAPMTVHGVNGNPVETTAGGHHGAPATEHGGAEGH